MKTPKMPLAKEKNNVLTADLPQNISKAKRIYSRQTDIVNSSNGIFVNKRIGKISEWVKISNFPLVQKRFIKVNDEKTYRLLQVGNDTDIDNTEPEIIKVNSESFISVEKLKRVLSNHDKHFVGITQKDLDLLAVMYEGMQPTEQVKVGFNPAAKTMFFKNAAVTKGEVYTPDQFGIVEIGGHSYFMQNSIQKTPNKNIDRYLYDTTQTVKFNDWFKLLHTAWGNRAVLPVCFLIMSIFRDVVDRNSMFIPVLYVKGERGSGKSTLISNLSKAFGAEQKETNLMAENTPKALARRMSQTTNTFTWFNEYKNDLPDHIKFLPQYIYDKGGYERAKFDDTDDTETVEVNSTLILTSNFTPDNDIIYTRLIFVRLDKAKHNEEQIKAVNQLADYKNLSCLCCELQEYYDLINDNFDKTKKNIFNLLFTYFKENGYDVDTRYIDNMNVFLTPTYILLEHKKITLNLGDYETAELLEIGKDNIMKQIENFNGNSTINEFWTAVEILFERYDIKKEYHLKKVDVDIDGYDGKTLLAVKTDILIAQYQKFLGNKAKSPQEIRDGLQKIKSFIEVRSVKFKMLDNEGVDRKPQTYKGAYIFDYEALVADFGIDFGF